MSLRSPVSFWQQSGASPLAAPQLEGDLNCEVAILGGGITGALIADQLTAAGIDAVLVDKRELGTGSTAASTGLLQYEVDNHLVDLIAKVGKEHAVHAYARGLKAIEEIEQLTCEIGDGCGFSRRESLYFASHWWHVGSLKREYECRKEHGFDVDLLDRDALDAISSMSAACAIRSRGDAQIDPYRFTQCLLARAQRRGLRAFARSEVTDILEETKRVVLRTEHGSVMARRIVYATGYDSHRYLPPDSGSLHCTFAIASEPVAAFPGWPNGALLWETARPYFYARQAGDGRIIVGGEDTLFSTDHKRDELIERKASRLVQRFRQLFPEIAIAKTHAWAGTFGESKDGLAYIGQPADRPSAYFAIGYGGNGITFSMVAAKLIVDLYCGRENKDAEVFRFGR